MRPHALAADSDIDSNIDPARHVSRVDGLYAIKKDSVPAVVWNRTLPAAFRSWFDALASDALPSACVRLRTPDVTSVVRQACDDAGTPECPERTWFIKDVSALADIFAGIMSARRLQLRFDIISGNACKKFHTDIVDARLICTYRGPGTQYGVLTENTDPKDIFDVQSGSPILLRGTRWPSAASTGFRHRSPPIQGSGTTRLNLVLDAILDDDVYEDHLHMHPEWVRSKSC